MSGPLVSVVMTAYDEEMFIGEALDSVLAQTYDAIEVIVVDDGSADRTVEIAESYGVNLVRRQHGGGAAARNTGLAEARGEYWTIFDADDVMPAERIERQVEHLEQHPELGMVLGLTEAFVTPGEPRPSHWNPEWDDGPFPACIGTMLARREVAALVGPYDEELSVSRDFDWITRARDLGVVAGHLDAVLLRYRIHPGNVSADRTAVSSAMLGVLRESLARRRATAPGS
jgi:glycosyltransferase involved in cell wall biosynthesis